jgi:hypothetical protein
MHNLRDIGCRGADRQTPRIPFNRLCPLPRSRFEKKGTWQDIARSLAGKKKDFAFTSELEMGFEHELATAHVLVEDFSLVLAQVLLVHRVQQVQHVEVD